VHYFQYLETMASSRRHGAPALERGETVIGGRLPCAQRRLFELRRSHDGQGFAQSTRWSAAPRPVRGAAGRGAKVGMSEVYGMAATTRADSQELDAPRRYLRIGAYTTSRKEMLMPDEYATILYETTEHAAWITLNRPMS